MAKYMPLGKQFRFDPAARGFHVVYHQGEVNHCPSCGRTHWYVGRLTAECGFCAAALPLMETGMTGAGLFRLQHPSRRERPALDESSFDRAA